MNHSVQSVQTLHDDAYGLYNTVVVGGGNSSADTILANLSAGIQNLKANWRGKDAGVQINNVIVVYNAMTGIRNYLAELAATTSKIAADYRGIQNSNGAGLEALGVIAADGVSTMGEYADNADTINITPEANNGKIDAANSAMEQFITDARRYFENIKQNWTAGTGREELLNKFDGLVASANNFKNSLADVSSSITTALRNYGN